MDKTDTVFIYNDAGKSFETMFLAFIDSQIDSILNSFYDKDKVNAVAFHEIGGEIA